jgi:hypothetical protein
LRPLIIGRKRKYKLPFSAAYGAEPEREDLRAANIEVQVSECMVKDVPIDSGSGVNIMIAKIVRALGFTKFETIVKLLRMADQSKVVPIGRLLDVKVLVGRISFLLNFVVIDPTTPSSYSMLLKRPWLYKAKVKTDSHKKTFTFEKPKTTISWETIIHEGEIFSSNPRYTSEKSAISDNSSLINMVRVVDE